MRPVRLFSLFALSSTFAALALGCGGAPPAHWARGGAYLEIPRARWAHGYSTIDILPDGKVMVNGDWEISVDRSGRVFDTDADPIALLEPDGRIIGTGNASLGWMNDFHAARAGDKYAWLSVLPTGEVVQYDEDGDRQSAGVWIGCNGTPRSHLVCTLVTHVLALRLGTLASTPPPGLYAPPVGPGVGIGIGIGVH